MKPKLLVINLWGLGDVVITAPFLQAAQERFEVTLLAKPYAEALQARFWPGARVIPFVAPWTAFRHTQKYNLLAWPWLRLLRLHRTLRGEHFDLGVSGRWDPRDHFLLWLARIPRRLGFPRRGSQVLLSESLSRAHPPAHQYENWRCLARALGFELPPRERLALPQAHPDGEILVHTGAGQPIRVWPLERYQGLVARLRQAGRRVQVACDGDQRDWWRAAGEREVASPRTVPELLALLDRAGFFIGNDSGPGHLAALAGVPTFTIFGPQLPEWFAPLHPAAKWLEGKPCPHKPCFDYCRFDRPHCLIHLTENEVWARVAAFVGLRSG